VTEFWRELASADRWLLLKINRSWTTPFLDSGLSTLTDLHRLKWFAYGVFPAGVALWLWKGRKRALKVLIVAVLAMAAGDQLAYRVLKPWVARPRPSQPWVDVLRRAPGSGNGFPSNHAVNMSAAASVLSVAYPAYAVLYWAIALLIAYSRVYVGVHYPLDVLAGLLLGWAIGRPWAGLMLGSEKSGRKRPGSPRSRGGR
jgi:undecaprenyl-diphosphatase